jgi:hypothetical protein
MPYLSTLGQLEESWTFKSWGVKTYVFESWTFDSPDLLKYGISIISIKSNMCFLHINVRMYNALISKTCH